MKKLSGILLLIAAINCKCQCKVQKAQAFFTVSIPGMQLSDEQGNKINPEPVIERFIYLECKCSSRPTIDSVFYNAVLFTASVEEVEKAFSIGIKKDNGKPALLNAKKGNPIWKIYLLQAGGKTLQHELVKKILVKGKLDKKKFSCTITTETELSTPDRY